MNEYPFFYHFKNWIQGRTFIAGVELIGKVLMAKEEDGQWWAYGVTPGGLSASGNDLNSAYANFRTFMNGVLLDIAEQADDFEAFHAEVQRLMAQTDTADARVWEQVRGAIKAGAEVDAALKGLPKVTRSLEPHLAQCVKLTPAPIVVDTLQAEQEGFTNGAVLAQAA